MDDKALTIALAKKVGSRNKLAKHFGIGIAAVNNWVHRGQIGLSKRPEFRNLARQHGIRLPERWIMEPVMRAAMKKAA